MSSCITSNPSFGFETLAEEVAAALSSSIAGKTVLVTGVSPGSLGAYFFTAIAPHNPKLHILAGRNPSKLSETAKNVQRASPHVELRTLQLDLSSQAQVRKAAAEILEWPEPIDVLVNNAGVIAKTYQKTLDGLEMDFGTNHIGHFLFTNLIMPKLLQSKWGPRVINITSREHRLSDVRWEDLDFKDGKVYDQWRAYGQTKTANVLFTVALAEKLGSQGLRAFSVHPGSIMTNMVQGVSPDEIAAFQALNKELGVKEAADPASEFKTLSQGTSTHVVAAFDPALDQHNGAYLQDCQRAPEGEVEPYAVKRDSAARLWKLSEELVAQKFAY